MRRGARRVLADALAHAASRLDDTALDLAIKHVMRGDIAGVASRLARVLPAVEVTSCAAALTTDLPPGTTARTSECASPARVTARRRRTRNA